MNTHDELRKLAEDAIERSWIRRGSFQEAANPQTILALLDELEQYKKDAERYKAFFTAGLPITFLGADYYTKDELDSDIDASIAKDSGEPV